MTLIYGQNWTLYQYRWNKISPVLKIVFNMSM